MNGRTPVVVDTNVTVVANRRGGESIACASACAQALLKIKTSGILVLDDGDRILTEYRRYLSHAGQPGMGDSFFKWLVDNRWKQDLVTHVTLILENGGFAEFPQNAELAGFDRADRVFVAVSLRHGGNPRILNATDRDWWDYRHALERAGVVVEFLCGERFDA